MHALVQAIADETFAYLFGSSQVPIGEANWLSAWVALSGEEILGVTMTRDEWVSDLWVRRDSRRTGIGGSYWHMPNVKYAAGDMNMTHFVFEWSSRTFGPSSSIKYGWRVQREFPHEKFGHTMFEMTKSSEMPPVS